MTAGICPRFAKIDPWGETSEFCRRWFSFWSVNCGRDGMGSGQNAMRFVQSGVVQWWSSGQWAGAGGKGLTTEARRHGTGKRAIHRKGAKDAKTDKTAEV